MTSKFTLTTFIFVLLSCMMRAQTFTSNLPILIITTNGGTIQDEPKIEADMGIVYDAAGGVNSSNGPFNNYNGKIGIEFRGSSSQMFPKKPYGIELHDAASATISASLLGMPEGEDWVLNAAYNDRSLVRDALTYALCRSLGRYAPRTRFVELVINSQYQGIYFLGEKIKRDKNRVDISKIKTTDISGDNLTGGYIIKIDKTTGNSGEGFISAHTSKNTDWPAAINFQYDYPKYDKIVDAQKIYIQDYIKSFEDALMSADYKDPVTGYARFIDTDSFIDFLIMNELTRNVDGYRLSTYLYKDKDSKGGKLFMGPIWDFNLGYGNADYCDGYLTTGWAYDFNKVCSADGMFIPFWWERLLSDSFFKQKLAMRWSILRAHALSTITINTYIDSMAIVFSKGSLQRNTAQWPVWNEYVWPTYDWQNQQNFSDAITWLKNWITARTRWLDTHISAPVTAVEEEHFVAMTIQASPNPFTDYVWFDYEIRKPGTVEITLFDMTGRKIESMNRRHDETGKFSYHYVQGLSAGMYYYKANFNNTTVTVQRLMRP